MPQAHTQHYGGVSTSKTSRTSNESPELIRYLELGEKVEKIEQAIERVENNEYLKNKYPLYSQKIKTRYLGIMDPKIKLENGSLMSFAPTLLKYMDIAIPKEMKNTDILITKK